ncbi:MAG: hypothetical protein HKM93_21565 [Desulfobacteraceae bacterium]|nr:hypothetical protein [Desulfobacteraceae bacterium]
MLVSIGKIVSIFLVFLFVLGCAVGPVEMDLVNYINQDIMSVAAVEQAALDRYTAVSGMNYESDEKLYETLNTEVVPTYHEFVNALALIQPETKPLKRLHASYIDASVLRLRGFETITNGIRLQDPHLITAANQMFAQSKAAMDDWRQALQELYAAHGIIPQGP